MSQNDYLVLIAGPSGTGKTASLMNLENQEGVMYLNCEAAKRTPFANKFANFVITDPNQVLEAFTVLENNDYKIKHPQTGKEVTIHTVVIDTLTFLMDMYESKYVLGSSNTMIGWSNYNQFFKMLMQDKVAKSRASVLVLAHTLETYNEQSMSYDTKVPVKGSLKNQGIEAYFSCVVSTKRLPLTKLENYKSDLLTITEEDESLGLKHVFQTRPTKETTGERIRAPMGLFTQQQTYIDNDAQKLLNHLHNYYN